MAAPCVHATDTLATLIDDFARSPAVADPPGREPARGAPLHGALAVASRLFDGLEARWEAPRTRRATAALLVLLFVASLVAIELRRRGWLPGTLAPLVPVSHLAAVSIVFGFLLVFEVASLVFALARSVADSLGKQFELLALILLREAFVEFGHASEPLDWAGIAGTVPHVVSDMLGGLAVFALLVAYYRVQRHRAITADGDDQANFVAAKKAVSVLLLAAFIALGVATLLARWRGGGPSAFFATFYTVLVLSDVLLVLISLRYSATFHVVFRNAAFAAATVLIRLALSAPPYINVLLATGAVLFALATSLAYNAWRGPGHVRGASEA